MRRFVSPQRKEVAIKEKNQQTQKWIESVMNGGLITVIDPADIQLNQFQKHKNCDIIADKIVSRAGTSLYGPGAPSPTPVLKFISAKFPDNTGIAVRFTSGSVFKFEVDTQTYTVLTGPALTGEDNDRIQTTVVFDKLAFTNNGVQVPMLIDFAGNTYAQLGNNTQKFRYITSFSNRFILAAERNVNEVLVKWSAEHPNSEEFDGLVDESAGESIIVDNPADLGDYIKGIFGSKDIMTVLRENSIWIATKQPIASAPFFFRSYISGEGCDASYSAVVGPSSFINMITPILSSL